MSKQKNGMLCEHFSDCQSTYLKYLDKTKMNYQKKKICEQSKKSKKCIHFSSFNPNEDHKSGVFKKIIRNFPDEAYINPKWNIWNKIPGILPGFYITTFLSIGIRSQIIEIFFRLTRWFCFWNRSLI